MKIVVCPDSFKGSLTAGEAANAISEGVKEALNDAEVVILPLADGGEGTLDVVRSRLNCDVVNCKVSGPMIYLDGKNGMVNADYLISGDGIAFIEIASAAGLTLVKLVDRDPFAATTYGVGELINDAISRGAGKIIIGLGGSATCDGGMGMLCALGFRFYDSTGRRLEGRGSALNLIDKIEKPSGEPLFEKVKFIGACDVRNPLYGETGAAYVFAPQKGAHLADLKILDMGLRNLARVAEKDLGVSMYPVQGGGAAGGVGSAIAGPLYGELKSGIEILLDLMEFENIIADADMIVTGEGCVDGQSMMGKVVSGVWDIARRMGKPVLAIGGTVKENPSLKRDGLKVIAATPEGMCLETAMKRDVAIENLRRTACLFFCKR